MSKKHSWYTIDYLCAQVRFTLCTSKKEFDKRYKKAIEKRGIRIQGEEHLEFVTEGCNATLHSVIVEDGNLICMCCIDKSTLVGPMSDHFKVSIVVHEALHILQRIRKIVAEGGSMNEELEAYTLQSIVDCLLKDALPLIRRRENEEKIQ